MSSKSNKIGFNYFIINVNVADCLRSINQKPDVGILL